MSGIAGVLQIRPTVPKEAISGYNTPAQPGDQLEEVNSFSAPGTVHSCPPNKSLSSGKYKTEVGTKSLKQKNFSVYGRRRR